MGFARGLEVEDINEKRVEETRKRMRESQKRLEIELREMRRQAPHTHKDDHRVVINI